MRNIWRLFRGDLKRISRNVVTAIIVLGLVFIPSIFSWYNIIGCWNVFDNTSELKVAVVNLDDGYKSDLVPIKMNIGEQVVSALRANDQLSWTFTDEDDAIDGVASGEYYAAVVIPESFSKDMMTFYSADVQHATIRYYTNEKKSAIAPKVTDQGADQVSYRVNDIFTQTVAEAALNIAASLSEYVDGSGTDGAIANLSKHVGAMGTQMSQTAAVLSTYSSLLGSAQTLVDGSAQLISAAGDATDQVGATAAQGQQAITTISDALSSSSDALSAALKKGSESYAGVSDSIDQAFAGTGRLSADASAQLRQEAVAANAQADAYEELVTQLSALEESIPADQKPAFDAIIAQLQSSVALQRQLAAGMEKAADDIDAGNSDAQADYAEVKRLAQEAQQSVTDISNTYETDIEPTMDELSASVGEVVALLEDNAGALSVVADDLAGSAGSVSGQMGAACSKLDDSAAQLSAAADKLSDLSMAITQALASDDTAALRALFSSDTTYLASVIASPVQLDRHEVFPADNFGSQMAPLYTTLALWIGALLMAVAIKVNVSEAARGELDEPKPRELFLGRFGVFALLSFAQSTCMAVGDMFFLHVQVAEPFLYLLCFWISGLVFTFIIYSLVVSFANLGKAIAVLFLIIQVTSGGGSFPLQMLPKAFEVLSPYLPATHVIGAMRAAMMGLYQNDFWIQMGELLLFVIPFALLGLALRKPLERFLNWYVSRVEDSKLAA